MAAADAASTASASPAEFQPALRPGAGLFDGPGPTSRRQASTRRPNKPSGSFRRFSADGARQQQLDWRCPVCNRLVYGKHDACVDCSVDINGKKADPRRVPWRCMECNYINQARADFCNGRSWQSDMDLEMQVADTDCMGVRGRMVQPGCAFMCDRWICAVCGLAASDNSWDSVILVDNDQQAHTCGQCNVSRLEGIRRRGLRHSLRVKEFPEGVRLFFGGKVPEYTPGGYQPAVTPVETESTQWWLMAGLLPMAGDPPSPNPDLFLAEFRTAQQRLEARRLELLSERRAILAGRHRGSGPPAAAASSADEAPGIMEV